MIVFSLVVVAVYMIIWFCFSFLLKRNDVADVAWGFGFVLLAWALYLNNPSAQLLVATLLVSLWGVRLGSHILIRNRKKAEDPRYQQWRKEWGRWFVIRSFCQVFMLQGFLLVIISAPIVSLARDGIDPIQSFPLITYLGVTIWGIGFTFEAVGDYQLRKFIQASKNKGKIMQGGLWRYSRHPNYFGEIVLWWGIWLVGFGTSWFWWSMIGPLTITFLILKVSGIPLLEKKYQGNQAFEAYKQRTSKLIPLPPKKG